MAVVENQWLGQNEPKSGLQPLMCESIWPGQLYVFSHMEGSADPGADLWQGYTLLLSTLATGRGLLLRAV